MSKRVKFMKMNNCFPRKPTRECQEEPPDIPPKTSQICLKAMPTLLKELTLDILSGHE